MIVHLSLYPTLFRWNRWSPHSIITLIYLYIPHCSDGTYSSPSLSSFLTRLYIPHCSDGTVGKLNATIMTTIFISHIVQMEQGWGAGNSSIWVALYPTLFRWNILCEINVSGNLELYIPHCSDGTKVGKLCKNSASSLYIPHCSDGTPPTWNNYLNI